MSMDMKQPGPYEEPEKTAEPQQSAETEAREAAVVSAEDAQAAEETAPEEEGKTGKKKKKKESKKKTVGQEILSWVWTILAAVVIATAIRAFVAEPVRVDGESMTNTLQDNEIVLVSKLDYLFGDLQRNDVVICRYPNRQTGSFALGASLSIDTYTLFVKRLVALPGDTVEIKDQVLYVNGEAVEDPEFMRSAPRDYEKRKLGRDEYFVIGDNRGNSHDSRAADVGPIGRNMIMGKVKCVLYPFNAWRGIK